MTDDPDYPKQSDSRRSTAFEKFAQNTGMHLVPYIVSGRHRRYRVAWGLLMGAAIVLLLSQIIVIFQKLYSYPTSAKIFVTYDSPLNFPAVTFCNLNPIAINKLPLRWRYKRAADKRDKNYKDLLSFVHRKLMKGMNTVAGRELPILLKKTKITFPKVIGNKKIISKNDSEPPQRTNSSKPKPKPKKRPVTKQKTREAINKDRLMYLINAVDPRRRDTFLYRLEDLLVACSFQGIPCDLEDFVRVVNPHFGSCFTFNSGMTAAGASRSLKQVTNSGMTNGLELTLFIDSPNYVSEVSDVTGFRVQVHDPNRPAMPDRNGHMLHPGAFTTLGVRLTRFKRVPSPHGKCKHFTEKEKLERNMFMDSLPLTTPGMAVCMRTCEQLAILKACNCYSLDHGFASAHAFDSANYYARKRPCDVSRNITAYNCSTAVLKEVAEGKHGCKSQMCRYLPCHCRRYAVSLSAGKWPTKVNLRKRSALKRFIRKRLWKTLRRSRKKRNYVRNNFLKVLVFMEDLNVINIESHPAYLFVDFLSELGAQAGLWLGISLVTIIEVMVMLGEIAWFYLNPIFTRFQDTWINANHKYRDSYETMPDTGTTLEKENCSPK